MTCCMQHTAYQGSNLVFMALEAKEGCLCHRVPHNDSGVLAAAHEHGSLTGIAQDRDGTLCAQHMLVLLLYAWYCGVSHPPHTHLVTA